ncbi:type I polyketide synthase [Sutterella sp.]|uniref:type I polyketide synthase n=1 Tax=Sutterella sp. TaxID=1981025 RepID=UPI0026DEC07E|nr:type I polyketide synthase [Sutterella sp.]MDO5531762.1 SDR family NAD(P)-dependent oxidoreductase [Sutterella sp.]
MTTDAAQTVAIIGIGCRFPGGIRTLKELEELLLEGRDAVGPLPADRFDLARYQHPDQAAPGATYAPRAGIVGDLKEFDARFWGFSEKEAEALDPQQRLVLEMTWEALEDAGIPPSAIAGSRTAVYIGASSPDMALLHADDPATEGPYTMTGTTLSIVSNRISYCLDLHGPSMTVDTACSSSLVALHEACQSILRGEADQAVAGGVNVLLAPMPFIGFSKAHMLSPTGTCRVFDTDADGYVRSEGGAVVLLKPLEKALADGDAIHAVIRATAVNSDGRTAGIALPSCEAQTRLLQEIYSRPGIDKANLVYLEAHGTGTAAGDPIETASIGTVLGRPGDEPLVVGSVKANLGHLETGSGMAGLAKAIAVLETGIVPKNIHFETPNPAIDFAKLGIRVPVENERVTVLPGRSLVGVNSFGFGGTNAHAVLECAPLPLEKPACADCGTDVSSLPLLLTAKSRESLAALAGRYCRLLEGRSSGDLTRIAAEVHLERDLLPQRLFVRPASVEATRKALRRFAAADVSERSASDDGLAFYDRDVTPQGRTAFVFSGNGSQWPGMCRDLYGNLPVFREAFDRTDSFFRPLAGWSLVEELLKDPAEALPTQISQPLLFACQTALLAVLKEAGVRAEAFAGHSVGEVAAAYAAGALSLEDAVRVIFVRSREQGHTVNSGTMAAVHLKTERFEALLRESPEVSVAGANAPESFTVSGPKDAVSAFCARVRPAGGVARGLGLPYAFHSAAMDKVRDAVLADLGCLQPKAVCGFYSTVTATRIPGEKLDASYWWQNIRQTVRFADAIECMVKDGVTRFLEIGPHGILTGYLRTILRSMNAEGQIAAVMRKGETAKDVDLRIGRVIAAGWPVSLEWPDVHPSRELPLYPWNRRVCWPAVTPGASRLFAPQKINPMLGWPVAKAAGTWVNQLDAVRLSWLSGHVVDGNVLFPAAGFVEAALAAGRSSLDEKAAAAGHRVTGEAVELKNLAILRALPLPEREFRLVRTCVAEDGTLELSSKRSTAQQADPADSWAVHLKCRVTPAFPERVQRPFPKTAESLPGEHLDVQAFYTKLRGLGLEYRGEFLGLEAIVRNGSEAVAKLAPSNPASTRDMLMPVPAFDAALQCVFAAIPDDVAATDPYLPVWFGGITLAFSGEPAWCVARLVNVSERTLTAEIEIFDKAGLRLCRMTDVRLRRAPRRAARPLPEVFREVWRREGAESAVLREVLAEVQAIRSGAEAERESADVRARLGQFLAAAYAFAAVKRFDEALPAELLFADDFSVENEGFAQSLAELLVSVGAAEAMDELFTVRRDAKIPRADVLMRTALARCPADWPLWLAAQEIGRNLPALLAGDMIFDEALPEGAHGLLAARRMTPSAQAASARLAKALDLAIARVGNGVMLRVGVAAGERPEALRAFTERAGESVTMTVVAADAAGASRAAAVLRRRPGLTVTHYGALEGKALFDIVIVPEGFGREIDPSAQAVRLLKFLEPGGLYLALEEAPGALTDFIEGPSPDWWTIGRDGQCRSRLMNAEAWENLAARVGLTDVAVRAEAATAPALLVSGLKAAGSEDSAAAPAEETKKLLATALRFNAECVTAAQLAAKLKTHLTQSGITVAQDAPERIVSILDADAEGRAPVETLALAQEITAAGFTGEWVIVTESEHPLTAHAISGLARVIRNEYPALRVRTIELADTNEATLATASRVIAGELEQDALEVRVEGGETLTASVESVRVRSAEECADAPELLATEMQGKLDRLAWRKFPRRPLGADEIRVAVRASGLNFRDVMWAMGVLPEEALEHGFAGPTLGLEAAGIVTEVGGNVTRVAVGDPVIAFAPACHATEIITNENAVALKPANLSFEEAASLPVAFFTVWYAVTHLARARRGERILVHGAAGGVGLAAIQIAAMLGLEVYATAGTPAKRALLKSLGVPHIYDSRTLAFAEEIRRDTEGRGVDMVLNSLAGAAAEKSLGLLAPFGRFLELGKRDFYADSPMFLRPFGRNLSYFGIDVDQLLTGQPEVARDLFSELMGHFASGALRPTPITVYPRDRAVEAFQAMQASAHIGKLVISIAQDESAAGTFVGKQTVRTGVRADATYVITGGMGGLGLAAAKRLVQDGARSVVLVSRRGAVTDEQKSVLETLRSRGAVITALAADASANGFAEALAECVRTLPPVAGVIHAAGVIDDALAKDQTPERMERTWNVKVKGAEALDRFTREHAAEIDFFVLFSSATVLLGNPGQANYVAANAAEGAIVRRRLADGLPATVIGWGPVGDVGMLKDAPRVRETIEKTLGTPALTSDEVLDALFAVTAAGIPESHFMAIDWRRVESLPTVASERFSAIRAGAAEAEHRETGIREELAGKSKEEGVAMLVELVADEVAHLMGLAPEELSVTRQVSEIGMDSLTVVELAIALEEKLGVRMSGAAAFAGASITTIAERFWSTLSAGDDESLAEADALREMTRQHGVELSQEMQKKVLESARGGRHGE